MATRARRRTLTSVVLWALQCWGCLPAPPPFRCDLHGGDRACDSVQGARCVEGHCAAPVPIAVCPSGLRYTASGSTPGACAPTGDAGAHDATTDADTTRDVATQRDVPDAQTPHDAIEVDAVDTPDVMDAPDAVDTPAVMDAPAVMDTPDAVDAPDAVDTPDVMDAGFSTSPPTRVAEVVAGYLHTCARLVDGTVWCWGHNEQGQVGVGTPDLWHARAQRVSIGPVVDLVAGAYHTCARTEEGAVFCWGRNREQQLGAETPEFGFVPLRVQGLPAATALAVGGAHTCAVSMREEVWCWGSNTFGALGVDGVDSVAAPQRVRGVSGGLVVAGDAFTCAGGGSDVWCWGRNAYGELGAPSATTAHTATPRRVSAAVPSAARLVALYAGGFSVCARSDVATRCWGRGDYGALGNGILLPEQSAPSAATQYTGHIPVMGYTGQCRVATNGATACWGTNDLGANGTGDLLRANAPGAALSINVARAEGVPVMAVGLAHTCALDETGALRCWGARYFGQLGDGVPAVVPTPTRVTALEPSVGLALGRGFTCVLRSETGGVMRVQCAGTNAVGQLGGSSRTRAPLPTVEVAPVTVRDDSFLGLPLSAGPQLVDGGAHACALGPEGVARCWGYNAQGQLNRPGSSATFFGAVPLQGLLPPRVRGVDAGDDHTCVVELSGTVRCWGANTTGQLGVAPSSTMQGATVPGVASIVQVAAGRGFTCARSTSGEVSCFGANSLGQCGLGTQSDAVTPAPAGAMITASQSATVSAGQHHACALSQQGVSCWGGNGRGQCGVAGTVASVHRPTLVAGTEGASDLKAGGSFSCMVRSGRVFCWGANTRGQLGDGTLRDRPTPAPVALPAGDPVAELACGEEHACARLTSGHVYCWGSNHVGQLALAAPLWVPGPVESVVAWPR